MGGVHELLTTLDKHGLAESNFLGVLNVLIGRQVRRADGGVVSAGATWRELAAELKKIRWDKEAVRELGLNPKALPPRDRERYWYVAIAQGQVDSAQATAAGDRLAGQLEAVGYVVGPAPRG